MAASINRTMETSNMVSFVHALAGSARFTELFAEGMQLVDEAAAYLDGPGRREAEVLSKGINRAYSAESMRLTTRLMQIASWLLIRRAVSTGEISTAVATPERIKVKVSAQNMVSSPSVFAQLPGTLQRLTTRSLRLQSRILHLDRMVNVTEQDADPHIARRGLDQQFERLHLAYRSPGA
jgi:regulator of CtrA degradation